jgi:hypothetical protein
MGNIFLDDKSIIVTLLGGTKLAFPATQKNDENSDYNRLFACFKSASVLYDGEWIGDSPLALIEVVHNSYVKTNEDDE